MVKFENWLKSWKSINIWLACRILKNGKFQEMGKLSEIRKFQKKMFFKLKTNKIPKFLKYSKNFEILK